VSAHVDIAVVGAGAAGIAAAVCAARAGAKVLLLDTRPAPGGTGGFSGLTTLCGLYDDVGKFLNEGFAREFAEALTERGASLRAPVKMGRVWVLPYRPERFRAVAAELISSNPNLQTQWHSSVTDVQVAANRIMKLNGQTVGAVIDCSGTAEVAYASGAEMMATDETTQAPAVIFPLHYVSRPLDSAADMAQVLLPLARAGFPSLHLQASIEPNIFTAKFAGTPEQVPQLIAFLRANVSGFEGCDVPLKEFTTARRAGRMIVGQYVLTGADVLAGGQISRCCSALCLAD
jgi:hypothetical protein